ncbi:MAG TPA: SAF domain-containing protein [Corynebacterium sp.]|nr:SAF domain-containing protein [Corynebacterium sp.]
MTASFSPPNLVQNVLRPPGHRRSLVLRRFLALLLVGAAGFSLLHSTTTEHPRIVVFAREVEAGTVLDAEDLTLRAVPADLIPEVALSDPEQALGLAVTAGAGSGEPVTSARLLGPEVINSLVGPSPEEAATMVPVTLADPDVSALLRHGDTVSIVTVAEEGREPVVVAAGARVILAGSGDSSESVLVALGHGAAERVAAASLSSPLAVVLTGERAAGE